MKTTTSSEPGITPAAQSQGDQLERLRQLYTGLTEKRVSMIDQAIEIGSCVSALADTLQKADKEKRTYRAIWTELHAGGKVPFAWTQALRYKKLHEKADEVREWVKSRTIDGDFEPASITIEAAYNHACTIGQKAPSKQKTLAPFRGMVFGVSNEKLNAKRKELEKELAAAMNAAQAAQARIHELRDTRSAIERVQAVLNNKDVLKKASRFIKAVPAIEQVEKVYADVAPLKGLVELAARAQQVAAGENERVQEYRRWIVETYSPKQEMLRKKLAEFCKAPTSTCDNDKQFAKQMMPAEELTANFEKANFDTQRKVCDLLSA